MKIAGSILAAMILAAASVFATAPSTSPASRSILKENAEQSYKKAVEAYLCSKWDALTEALKDTDRYQALLTPQQISDLGYVRKMAAEFRPAWWKSAQSTTKTTFQARIWDRPITVNYAPLEQLTWSANVDPGRKAITSVISWNPSLVDEPKAIDGDLTKYSATIGNSYEILVWHQIGYSYVLSILPPDTVVTLFTDHRLLFDHLQSFYALMTGLYHCSPRARVCGMTLLAGAFGIRNERPSQARGAWAVGSILLSEVLADPSKWPSLRLPDRPPEKDAEQTTITYLLSNIEPTWTLAEDKALRDMIHTFITTKGDSVLRTRGEVPLSNKLTLKLQVSDDRELQKKRDAWVTERLTKLGEKPPVKKGDSR